MTGSTSLRASQSLRVCHHAYEWTPLPCSTLPSLGLRNAGYAGRKLDETKFVFWCELGRYFAPSGPYRRSKAAKLANRARNDTLKQYQTDAQNCATDLITQDEAADLLKVSRG